MLRISYNEHRVMSKLLTNKFVCVKPKAYTGFECVECMSSDGVIIAEAPHVIECSECGHPNDVRWDNDECDIFDLEWSRHGAT